MPTNFRPISLTSHIVKIFERVIRKKLLDYLEINGLICNQQHGFISGRSCLTQLLHHFDDVLLAVTSNSDFDSIYLDYTKAFDNVDHALLLRKLQIYNIHPKIIRWIESFLQNRKQAVFVGVHYSVHGSLISPWITIQFMDHYSVHGSLFSPWITIHSMDHYSVHRSLFSPCITIQSMDHYSVHGSITSGLPQGTVLGPILFLVFINDVNSASHTRSSDALQIIRECLSQ